MKRITPNDIYQELPCSVVATGCALNIGSVDGLNRLISPDLHADGYLSLDGMNKLIRANTRVSRKVNYRRGERPTLAEWADLHKGVRAAICVLGHFLYFDGSDYYSFFCNDSDPVVCVWELA